MMKIKRQNKLRTYLAVTAGVGCAGSVSNAAVVMIDVSDFSGPNGGVPSGNVEVFGAIGGLGYANLAIFNGSSMAFGLGAGGSLFLGARGFEPILVGSNVTLDGLGLYSGDASDTLFAFGTVVIPAIDGFGFLPFLIDFGADQGVIGFFQVTFDGDDMFEILGGAFESVAGNPITTFDTTAVPEPSSLVLLALGATGLAARRKRKMAA